MKKNNFKSLAAVLSLAMAATAVPVNANAATTPKITVSKKTVYSGKTYSTTVNGLKKGYTVNLSSTEGGINFKQKKVTSKGAKVTVKFTVQAASKISDNKATKIKAVVKNEKGKKVKTVNQKVTLKQLAKSLTVKDPEQTTYKVGDTVNIDATIAPKAAKGAYNKLFSCDNSDVLETVKASSGEFKAIAPGTATITVTATNDKGKVVEGSKVITITVEAADTTPDGPNVTPDDPGTVTGPSITTGPAITTECQLLLTSNKTSIQSNSKDSADLELLLKAPSDVTLTKDMAVAVRVGLDTKGIGSLSAEDVTLNYDAAKGGLYGTLKFTSATLLNDTKSRITASIYSVTGMDAAEKEKLIGLAATPLELTLTRFVNEATESHTVTAVKAVIEDLDRVLITFNEPVQADRYLIADKKYEEGKVANGVNTTKDGTSKPQNFELYIRDAVPTQDNEYPTNANTPAGVDFTHEDIADVVQVDANTLAFVLRNGEVDKDALGQKSGKQFFTNNSKFLLTFVDISNGQKQTGHSQDYISDTTVPTPMRVDENDMRSIIVTFDQPVYSAVNVVDDNDKEKDKLSALIRENFTIDGRNLDIKQWKPGSTTETYYGDPSIITVELVDKTKRDQVKITLGKDGDAQRYFAAGAHMLEINSVGDYAALTSSGTNNRISTKSFNFSIKENTTVPAWTVKAQSAEQYKVTFNCRVEELNKYKEGTNITTALPIDLRFKDTNVVTTTGSTNSNSLKTAMTEFASATLPMLDGNAYKDGKYVGGLGQTIQVVKLPDEEGTGNTQVKVEVTQDWTKLKNYEKPNFKNYFNYQLQLFLDLDKVTNEANGKKNAVLTGNLSGDNIQKPDVTTPVIQDAAFIEGSTNDYKVTFSEPVQAGNNVFTNNADKDLHANTPGRNDDGDKLGNVTAEFVSKKTNLSYRCEILRYDDWEDVSIAIRPETELPLGEEFTLIVRGISDDVGNTSNTLTKDFRTGEAAATQFKILSVLADGNYSDPNVTDKVGGGINNLDDMNSSTKDAVYVEFSSQYKAAPMEESVLNVNHWTINGASLPTGTKILNGIKGKLNNDDWFDSEDPKMSHGHSGITIVLPEGTITKRTSTLVKVAPNVKDVNGNSIVGDITTYTTPTIIVGDKKNTTDTSLFEINGDFTIISKRFADLPS